MSTSNLEKLQASNLLRQQQKSKPHKILLIGETGSGKTTLVELLRNYEAQYGNEFKLELVKSMVKKEVIHEAEKSEATKRPNAENESVQPSRFDATAANIRPDAAMPLEPQDVEVQPSCFDATAANIRPDAVMLLEPRDVEVQPSCFDATAANIRPDAAMPLEPQDVEIPHPSKRASIQMSSDTKSSTTYELDFGDLIQLDVIDTPGFGDTEGKEMDKIQISNMIQTVKAENYINCVGIVINGTRARLTLFMREVLEAMTHVLPESILSNIIIVLTNTRSEFESSFEPEVLHEQFGLNIPKENIFYLNNPFAIWSKVKAKRAKLPDFMMSEFKTGLEIFREILISVKSFPEVLTNTFGEFFQIVENLTSCLAELRSHDHNILQMTNSKEGETYRRSMVYRTEERHVVCDECLHTCHKFCNCPFADFFSIFFCKRFQLLNHLDCTECGHPIYRHTRGRYYYEIEEETVFSEGIVIPAGSPLHAITLTETHHELQERKEKTEVAMHEHLTRFQIMASSFWQNKTRANVIQRLEQSIRSIRCIDHERVTGMLEESYKISQNPFSSFGRKGPKIRWACGILGIKDDTVSEEKIKTAFRELARLTHPDTHGHDDNDLHFKLVNHAQEYLLKLPIKTVKKHMPKLSESS